MVTCSIPDLGHSNELARREGILPRDARSISPVAISRHVKKAFLLLGESVNAH